MKTLLAILVAVIGISFTSHVAEAGGKGGARKHYHYTKTYIVKIKADQGWKVVYRGKNYAYAKTKAAQYRAHGCYVVFY